MSSKAPRVWRKPEDPMSRGIAESVERANEQSEIVVSMAAAMEEMTVGIYVADYFFHIGFIIQVSN